MKPGLSLIILLWALVFKPFDGTAQGTFSWSPPDTVSFALTPVKRHTVVKGLAFGLTANPYGFRQDSIFTAVRGVNVEVGPFGALGGIFGTMYGLLGDFYKPIKDDSNRVSSDSFQTAVHGISVSLFGLTESSVSGVTINGLCGLLSDVKGIQVSGLLNTAVSLQGISIASIFNAARKINGLQVGLINNCRSGNVVQIGLFNRIGRRVIPFINLNFSRKKRSASDTLRHQQISIPER